jgi:hypothetical protein
MIFDSFSILHQSLSELQENLTFRLILDGFSGSFLEIFHRMHVPDLLLKKIAVLDYFLP